MLLISLTALFSSTIRNPQFYVDVLTYQKVWNPWMAPSITAFNLAQICPSWHALVDLYTVTFSTHFVKMHLQFSPIPTGRTPDCVLSDIIRPDINTRQAAQGGL